MQDEVESERVTHGVKTGICGSKKGTKKERERNINKERGVRHDHGAESVEERRWAVLDGTDGGEKNGKYTDNNDSSDGSIRMSRG